MNRTQDNRTQDAGTGFDAAVFAAIAGLGGAMWAATVSAGAGRFAPLGSLVVGLAIGVCVAIGLGGVLGIPRRRRGVESSTPRAGSSVGGAEAALIFVVAIAAFRAWPPSVAWPAFLDGGWYAATAAMVARHGDLNLDVGPAADPVFVMRLADQRRAGIGVPLDESRGFHAVAFAVADPGSGIATPYHPPLYTSWLAIFADRFGPDRLALGGWIWAVAWLLALGALARRAFGPWAAPWAVALAGVSPLWRFFAPQPFAELAAGALVLTGLGLLAMPGSQSPAGAGGSSGAGIAGSPVPPRSRPLDPPLARPLVAGLLLGLAALTKLDAVPIVIAVVIWWCWMSIGRSRGADASSAIVDPMALAPHAARVDLTDETRPGVAVDPTDALYPGGGLSPALALLLGLVPAAAHAVVLAQGSSAVYYKLNLWGVRSAALTVLQRLGGGPALALLATAVVVAGFAAFRTRTRGIQRPRRGAAIAVDAGSGVAQGSATRAAGGAPRSFESGLGAIGRAALAFGPAAIVVALWLRDRPVGDSVAAAPSLSTILVWAITPLGAWAALATWAWIVRGSARSAPPMLFFALLRSPLVPAAIATAIVLAAPLVTRTLSPLYVGRRLLPVALPLACILAAGGALSAWRRGGLMRTGLVVAALVVGAVQLRAGQPLAPGRDLAGARLLMERFTAYGGDDDLLIFPSSLTDEDAGRLAAAVWALDGRDVAVVGSPEPDAEVLAAAVHEALATGRRIFWIGAAPPPPLAGIDARSAGEESVITEVLAPDPVLPPRMIQYELSAAVHELFAVDVGEGLGSSPPAP